MYQYNCNITRIIVIIIAIVGITNIIEGANIPAGENFKIGLVRDQFLRYQEQDNFIFNGVQFWTNWVNQKGGLFYNNSYHDVVIIQEDTSTPNPNLTSIRIVDAYERMVSDSKVDLIVSPFSTLRTVAAMGVSEKYKMINIAPAVAANLLISNPNTYLFNTMVASEIVPYPTLDVLIAAGAKNYVIIRRPDTAAVVTANSAVNYLSTKGITQLADVWVNISTLDSDEIQSELRKTLNTVFSTVDSADAILFSALTSDFSTIISVFSQVQPNVKAAVYLIQNSPYDLEANSLQQSGKYWLSCSNYVGGLDLGVSGQYGGSNSEFEASFYNQFQYYPRGVDALVASQLMSYYYAVNLTGSIEPSIINTTLKTMGVLNTFARKNTFLSNGTNEGAFVAPIQYDETGIGRPVTATTIVYPAPFNKKGSTNVKLIVAIVVPIGVVILIVAIAGAWYTRKQRTHAVKALVEAEEGERRNYKIDYSSLTLGPPIGAGGFGIVYKGDYRGADVAVKKLKAQKMTKNQLDEFAKESAVMIGLRHPNILLFMGVCVQPPELCIVTEFMPRGSLYDVIHNEDIVLPFPLVKSFILDAIRGLQFIHSANLIHRDLKSPNLLVDRSWNVKIADFGLSATKAKSEDDVQISLLWTAPEILDKQPGCYSEKSDTYSLGIIIWELLARKTPFEGLNAAAIPSFIVNGKRPTVDNNWDNKITQLMEKCWSALPEARPTMKEARSMAELVYADPSFEIGSSSGLVKYVGKAQPPTGTHVTFVYTSVYNSAKLWEHDPHVMMRSLSLHSGLLRENMLRHEGYEIKSDGEAFLIAFSDPIQAANFCLTSQILLLNINWAENLLKHPDAAEERSLDNELIYRGLSVCMGVLNTPVSMDRNPNNGRFEYFTNELGTVGILAKTAGKGWINMTAEMYTKVMAQPDRIAPFYIEEASPLTVGGKSLSIFQMTLKSFHERDGSPQTNLSYNDFKDCTSTVNFEFPPRQEKWVIQFSEIELKERIGAGSFGEVKLANYRGTKVAVKQILRQKLTDANLLDLHAESAILSSLNHPNVLSFVGVCLKLPNLCLVTEYMDNGSLDRLIFNNPNSLSWNQKLKMASDIAQGMKYLHGKGVIHRDVKMPNMLVAQDYTIKIADFGYSRMRADNQTMTQVGTVSYSAPEIFDGSHYTDKADIYSLGIVFWELVCNKKAWDKKHGMKIANEVINGNRPPITECPPSAPPVLILLIQECWAQDPAKRPSPADICNKFK